MTAAGLDLETRHLQLIPRMGAFRKVQGSDVVEVANHTLEQDELKYMTGSRRSYAAVLTADKKNDLSGPRRRNG